MKMKSEEYVEEQIMPRNCCVDYCGAIPNACCHSGCACTYDPCCNPTPPTLSTSTSITITNNSSISVRTTVSFYNAGCTQIRSTLCPQVIVNSGPIYQYGPMSLPSKIYYLLITSSDRCQVLYAGGLPAGQGTKACVVINPDLSVAIQPCPVVGC